eukprot:6141938-Amphidinium_carterae.2
MSIVTVWVMLTPGELDPTLLVHHKMVLTVVAKTFRMLALVSWPDLGTACHRTQWSFNDRVLILEWDVVLMSKTPKTSSQSRDIDGVRWAPSK